MVVESALQINPYEIPDIGEYSIIISCNKANKHENETDPW